MHIDIREGIPHDLKKILEKKKCIFLLHLNEFNLNDDFENYTFAKIFYATSNDKNVWKKNIYIYIYIYIIQYAILILLLHYS